MNTKFLHPPCNAASSILVATGLVKEGYCLSVLWTHLEPVDRKVLDLLPDLKVVACPCTDVSHIDLAECHRRNIRVLSLRDTDVLPTITATAEHTIGLILALVRKIPQAVESTKRGEWDRTRFMGRELSGMSGAIIGFGRIGQMVHDRLRAFGINCKVLDTGYYSASQTAIVRDADCVSIHVDLNDTTRNLCNSEFFAAMKPDSYFINTSRGQVVDEAALLASLRSGHLAGAALDVVCGEPDGVNQALIQFANDEPGRLILTPHIGGFTSDSLEKAECALAKRLIQEIANEQA